MESQLALKSEDTGCATAHDQLKVLYWDKFGILVSQIRKGQATDRGLPSDPPF